MKPKAVPLSPSLPVPADRLLRRSALAAFRGLRAAGIGWGSTLDESKLKALPPGSFYTEPANVPHFVVTKGEPVIIQVSGTGPSASNFIAPGK